MTSTRLVVVLAALLSLPAAAADWKASFPADTMATYLDGAQRTLLVAAAGAPVSDVKAAAAALETAFRASGKARLVMGDAGLGSLLTQDDAQVVRQCAAMPVELIAVVRVFTGAAGAEPSVVVTLYDHAGGVQMAFSTTRGTPLQPHVGSGASASIHTVTAKEPPPPPEDAERQAKYDQRFLWTEATSAVSVEGTTHAYSALAYEGRAMRTLVGADFYEKVGRVDLATQYRGRMFTKYAAGAVGLAAMATGLIMLALPAHGRCVKYLGPPSDNQCQQYEAGPGAGLLLPALGLEALGLGALLYGIYAQAQPVGTAEVRQLVDEYNHKLKVELGLALTALPGGGLLAVGGTY